MPLFPKHFPLHKLLPHENVELEIELLTEFTIVFGVEFGVVVGLLVAELRPNFEYKSEPIESTTSESIKAFEYKIQIPVFTLNEFF